MQTWFPLLVPLLVAGLLVVLPGLLLAVAAGRRGIDALLMAPALSTTVLGIAAIVFGLTPLRWSAWMVAVLALLAAAALALVRWLWGRFGTGLRLPRRRSAVAAAGQDAAARTADEPTGSAASARAGGSSRASLVLPQSWRSWANLWPLLGLALGALLWARHLRNILGRPDVISQTFDNLFHISAIRFIMERGSASSLTLSALNAAPGTSQFYPAAWHGYVSLIAEVTGTQIPIAANAMLCTAVLIWVSSCQFLARCILPSSPLVAGLTGVLSASFTAFPGIAMSFGVLYPNLLGIALAPVMIGLGVQLLRVAPVRTFTTGGALGFLLLAAPGTALAHPNAVLTVVVFATAAILVRCIASIRDAILRRVPWWWAIVAAVAIPVYLIVANVLWQTLRPPLSQLRWEPVMNNTDSLGQMLVNGPLGQWPAWLVSFLVLAGVYRCLRRRENLWLPLAWVLLGYCWMIIASEPYNAWRIHITGVWYTDPFRVAMVLALATLPLALVGGVQMTELATRARWRRGRSRLIVAAVATVLLLALTQRAGYLNHSIKDIRSTYVENESSGLLTPDERALIERLPREVPHDAVVATDPWNGSSLAYALEGVRTTNRHALAYVSPDAEVLQNHLDEAAEDPEVCRAVDALHVRYALDFGDRNVNQAPDQYPGFDDLASAPGFRLVDQQGEAKLYEVTACGSQP